MLADRNVRLGLHHSMNFQKMISTVLRNDYERLPQHYTGYGEYSDNSIQPRTFDLDKADQYFTKAGFVERDGEGYRINNQGQRLSFHCDLRHLDPQRSLGGFKGRSPQSRC